MRPGDRTPEERLAFAAITNGGGVAQMLIVARTDDERKKIGRYADLVIRWYQREDIRRTTYARIMGAA